MQNLFIIGGVSVAIVLIFVVFDYLKSKGINAGTIITDVGTGLKTAENYTEAAVGLTTGKLKKVLEGANIIEKLAITACGYAQQMFISSQIKDDVDGSKRKETALNYIFTALKNEGIDVTDDVKTIATGIVENTVFSSKTIEEINSKIDKFNQNSLTALNATNVSLQKQITTLTADNAKLKTDNIQLEQKLTTIQSTAGTTVQK